MKILILWIGPWLDKGQAAMLISMVNALREKIPNVSITAMTSSFQPQDIDIIKYSKYNLKVMPGIFSNFNLIVPKLKFLKFKALMAMIALPLFLALMVKNLLWLLLYKVLQLDLGFLIRNNRDIVKEYRDVDWIIFCGGQNITKVGQGLFIAFFEIIFGKLFGKPVMIWANSLGPFNQKYFRPFIKWFLNKVDLITTREEISKRILNDIGVTAPVFVTSDAAFTLPPISQKDAMTLLERGTGIPKNELMVGITAIPWDFPSEKNNANKIKMFESYLEAMAGAVDYIIEKLNAHVIFFPQVILPPTKDDRPISMKVFNKIKNKSNVTVLTEDYAPEQLKGMYGCMSLLIGTRFHSCILAQSMNVPTIAIEYDEYKAFGIMSLLDLEEYVCNINTITTHELASKIDKIWTERDEVKKKLEKNIRVMQARCMDNVRLAVEYLGLLESP